MNFTEEESQIFELRPGDIVLAEASGSRSQVGKPALWRGEISGCCFQNTLLRVRTHGPLPEYLLYLLRAEALSGRLGDAARGVGIHHLGAARMSSWVVPLPPLGEQRRIVAAIEEQFSRLDVAGVASRSATRRHRSAPVQRLLSAATAGHWPSRAREADHRPALRDIIKSFERRRTGRQFCGCRQRAGGAIDRSGLKFATDADAELSSFECAGDILFVRTNGSRELIGRVAGGRREERWRSPQYLCPGTAGPIGSRSEVAVLVVVGNPSARARIESKAATTTKQSQR